MKVGINLLLWTAAPTVSEHGILLDNLKEWGFDVVELGVSGLTGREIDRFSAKAADVGLEISVLDVFMADEANPGDLDPAKRKRAEKIIKENIRKTEAIGSHIYSGPMFQGLCGQSDQGPTESEWKRAVETLRECALFASERGIKLAAEPLNRFEMNLVNTVKQAHRFALEVGAESFGILADTHHSNIEEYRPAEAWAAVIDRIYHVHISENNRGIPGKGHAVTSEIFSVLKNKGYDGYLVIEAFNANVPEIASMLRLWQPFVGDEAIIAREGLAYIKQFI